MNFLTTNLATSPVWSGVLKGFETWAVWLVLMVCTAVGVVIDMVVFPPTATLDTTRVTLLTIVIVFAMNNLTYAPKWANEASRRTLSPLEIGQYLVQGFGWAATWPALAQLIGSSKIDPANTVSVIQHLFG
jgi:hypothetical protein